MTSVPAAAGIGLRSPHVAQVLSELPAVPWFEVHSENYFAEGGPGPRSLARIAERYPLSLHGVGLSLGSAGALDRDHLARLRRLADRVQPGLVSEHLCWGRIGSRHYNDLLPLPYTSEALDIVASHVHEAQEALGRRILVENISAYWRFPESDLPEGEFLAALARRTGCGVLLDVNNLYVNQRNFGVDARAVMEAIPVDAVGEIHLAGFDASGPMLIDTHGTPVYEDVWALYEWALGRFGPRPTLIEWDTDIPEFSVLQAEAGRAQHFLDRRHALAA